MKKWLACIGILTISFPALAQPASAGRGLVNGGVKGVSNATVMKMARVSGGLSVPSVSNVGQAVRVQPTFSAPAGLSHRVTNALAPSVNSAAVPKMMATPLQYDWEPMQHLVVYGHNTHGTTGLSAMTAHREYTGPGLTPPAPASSVAPKKTRVSGLTESEMAYFHRWGKEGTVQDVYSSFAGDPYAAGQREIKRLERIVSNGVPSGPAVRTSGFELQLRREADAPTRLLSDKDLAEFNATLESAREIAQKPLPFARRDFDPARRNVVVSGKWDPTKKKEEPQTNASRWGMFLRPTVRAVDPKTQAQMYPNFNEKNYIRLHETFDQPFHPDVEELRVLVASDDKEFLARLDEAAQQDPRVHVALFDNVAEAEGELTRHPNQYHVVLTDLLMGKRNGLELAAKVQQEQLPCYVVQVSRGEIGPGRGFLLGFDGGIPNMVRVRHDEFSFESATEEPRSAREIFNYLSVFVANGGNAYPKEIVDW